MDATDPVKPSKMHAMGNDPGFDGVSLNPGHFI
jgi:hypothetical protein